MSGNATLRAQKSLAMTNTARAIAARARTVARDMPGLDGVGVTAQTSSARGAPAMRGGGAAPGSGGGPAGGEQRGRQRRAVAGGRGLELVVGDHVDAEALGDPP